MKTNTMQPIYAHHAASLFYAIFGYVPHCRPWWAGDDVPGSGGTNRVCVVNDGPEIDGPVSDSTPHGLSMFEVWGAYASAEIYNANKCTMIRMCAENIAAADNLSAAQEKRIMEDMTLRLMDSLHVTRKLPFVDLPWGIAAKPYRKTVSIQEMFTGDLADDLRWYDCDPKKNSTAGRKPNAEDDAAFLKALEAGAMTPTQIAKSAGITYQSAYVRAHRLHRDGKIKPSPNGGAWLLA
jgi:hypothetical protein